MENIERVIDVLERYLRSNKDDYTELEISIEKLIEEYRKVKEDLKLKNEILIKLAMKGL